MYIRCGFRHPCFAVVHSKPGCPVNELIAFFRRGLNRYKPRFRRKAGNLIAVLRGAVRYGYYLHGAVFHAIGIYYDGLVSRRQHLRRHKARAHYKRQQKGQQFFSFHMFSSVYFNSSALNTLSIKYIGPFGAGAVPCPARAGVVPACAGAAPARAKAAPTGTAAPLVISLRGIPI